jgi:hypothetical protein
MKRTALSTALILTVGLAFAQGGAEQLKPGKASGTISEGHKKLVVESCIATWDHEKGHLTIDLFPFELTQAQADQIAEFNNPFFVLMKQKSPDAQVWPDWCPYAELAFDFTPSSSPLQTNDVSYYHLNLIGWDKKQTTTSINVPQPQARKALTSLSHDPTSTAPLKLSFADKPNIGTNVAIDIQVEVLPLRK